MLIIFFSHKKKKKQTRPNVPFGTGGKKSHRWFDNLLKSTGHLSHATTIRSLRSLYGLLTIAPTDKFL
jgi:hypothetical protein